MACAVEALAQGGDSIDMGTGDFILLIRWQGAIRRDWRSGGGLKHLAWVLGRSHLRQGQRRGDEKVDGEDEDVDEKVDGDG